MAYRQTTIMDVWDVIRRWHDRQGIRQIARVTGLDRKTVQGYRRMAEAVGLSLERPLPAREEVIRMLSEHGAHAHLGRSPHAQSLLEPFLDEIRGLIYPGAKEQALKPKTAFSVLCERHPELPEDVSYTSYKRFVRAHAIALNPRLVTCRVEVAAGSEAQIDYASIGKLYDAAEGRMRNLYVFIGTLSHSRMKYVELTFSQDQMSFVMSHVRMFAFFGGVPERCIIDNLKSGVIRPSLYDPKLNKAYDEMREYYGVFIDPARVRHPKDKGKVERDVQTVREAVRKELVLHPDAALSELNVLMRQWSLHTYGERVHGTTREKPLEVLLERERPALKVLPEKPYEVSQWKQATVHPDHYIQFKGKAYSVPHAYVGKIVWVRSSEHILKVYCDEELIKEHLVTSAYRHTDFNDFPENVRSVIDTSYIHKKLMERASKIGPVFLRLINDLLSAHAYINLRRAQALVGAAEGASDTHQAERAAGLIELHSMKATPQNFKHLLARIAAEASTPNLLPLSEATTGFIRDITYFINDERPS
jgi:transposase